jgi:hypothetical protein
MTSRIACHEATGAPKLRMTAIPFRVGSISSSGRQEIPRSAIPTTAYQDDLNRKTPPLEPEMSYRFDTP